MSSSISVTSAVTSSSATSSGGCVECGSPPACPQCSSDEICVLTELTCTQCPTTKCVVKSGSSQSSGSSGKLVGGVVGGVVLFVALLLFFLYHRYWKGRLKERSNRLNSNASIYQDGASYFEEDDDEDSDEEDEEGEEPRTAYKKPMMTSASTIGDRNSTVTIQTRASNILPIAYIPGVTNGSGTVSGSGSGGLSAAKLFRGLNNSHLNNPGDMRSHITLGSSILGEIDDEEDDDEKLGKQASSSISSLDYKSGENMTTAIRAKPKLVQIVEEDGIENTTKERTEDESRENHQFNSVDVEKQQTQGDQEYLEGEEDDGEGSFILDLAIPDSIRRTSDCHSSHEDSNAPNADSGSPFEDKFEIEEST